MAHPKESKSEWITKEEAAKILGVNVRQVQKRAEQGYIEKRPLPRLPNERQARVVYARRDVEALAAGTPNQHAVMEPEAPANPPNALAIVPKPQASGDLMRQWVEATAALNRIAETRRSPRAWLTLDEAAEFSGLTKGWLLAQASSVVPMLEIRDMGKHARGGRWRFFRGDLERGE